MRFDSATAADESLRPVREEFEQSGMTEHELTMFLTEIRDEVRLIGVSALERNVDPLGILFECLKNTLKTQNPRKNFRPQTNDVIELAFELPFADSAFISEFAN